MKKITANHIMIAFAALAQGVLWVNVFRLLHDGILVYIGGIPAGVAVVGLVVYAANSLPRVKSDRARRAGWIMLTLVIAIEPVVLGFANFPVIMKQTITLPGANVVAGGASLIITLSLVLGAVVDRSLIPAEKPPKPVSETPKPRKRNSTKVVRKPITDVELLSWFQANPGTTDAEVAKHFEVTPQAIGKRRRKLYEVK